MELLTAQQVADTLAVSLSTLDRLRRTEIDFPKPLRLTANTVRWRRDQIDSYIQRRTPTADADVRASASKAAAALLDR